MLPVMFDLVTGELSFIIGTDALGLLVNISDSSGRDLGIVDLGKNIPGSSDFATNQVALGAAAVQIVPARAGRSSVTLVLITDAVDVFLGASGVSTATGLLLFGTKGMSIKLTTQDAVYGITGGSACTVSYWEDFD